MIEKQNTLEWLDFIITIALDSSQSEVNTLTQAQYENITEKAYEKKQKYIAFLNRQSHYSRRKIRQLIKQQHASLLILLDQATKRLEQTNPFNTLTISALQNTSTCIYELLTFIENSFGEYLDLDDRVPHAYSTHFQTELQNRFNEVKK
ncbi:MAG: hypothetical protein ABIN24_01915, partial [Dyadobacter sp.]